jgi:hypothetical protein
LDLARLPSAKMLCWIHTWQAKRFSHEKFYSFTQVLGIMRPF